MSDTTLDVGLAYKLKQALSRNGISDVADLDWLATGDNLAKVRQVRLGHADIVAAERIDCDADPFVPIGWSVQKHQRGALFKWDPANIRLYYPSKGQKFGKLCKDLAEDRVLNANVLDYLLSNQHLIPKEWRGRDVLFLGTIYRGPRGHLLVRNLARSYPGWGWSYSSLDWRLNEKSPVAVAVR